ncbi:MAG: diacylglycerol kinase family lipid kinase [Planctomycetaceae bacterium]
MNSPWVAIQRNPRSGSGPKRAVILELIREIRRLGIRPRLFSRREHLDSVLQDKNRSASLRCIVAAGGDGTVGDLINRHPGIPLAVLPLGTENLIAKYLGIPCSGRFVAEMIANGKIRTLDVCEMGDKRFSIMASVGFDADVVHRTHARRRGHIRKYSYLQPIWQSLRKYTYPDLNVFVDDNPDPLSGKLVVVVNMPAYAMKLPIASSAEPDDGLLDVRIFARGSGFQMLRYFYKVLRNRHEQLPDVTSIRASCIRIESSEPAPIQMDGDPAGQTPAFIQVVPSALQFYVPDS